MLNRSRFLRVYGADPVSWAERYGLEPFTRPCVDCGAEMTTSVAFASGPARGLIAPPCPCGSSDCPPYVAVLFWRELGGVNEDER